MEDSSVAIVTDNLNYGTSYQAFERPPDNQTLYSLVPRGIRRFFLATDVSIKPVNDELDVFMTGTLPTNFAYAWRSFNLHLESNTVGDFEDDIDIRLTNHIPGQELGTTEHVQVTTNLQRVGTGSPMRVVNGLPALSSFATPIWSVHGGAITFRVHLTNVEAQAGGAGFVVTHAEFYEYDLVQAQRYWVNTPIPVQTR